MHSSMNEVHVYLNIHEILICKCRQQPHIWTKAILLMSENTWCSAACGKLYSQTTYCMQICFIPETCWTNLSFHEPFKLEFNDFNMVEWLKHYFVLNPSALSNAIVQIHINIKLTECHIVFQLLLWQIVGL